MSGEANAMSEAPAVAKVAVRLSPAQGALLGCIRHGPKLRKQLSGLRSATWLRLSKEGLLTMNFNWREDDMEFSITAKGVEVYDDER